MAAPSRAESSPGTAGGAGALARGGGERTRALPSQRLATLGNTVPSLKYLGLVGLSLQLKLKHESSPGCCSLCAAFECGLCQQRVMETAEGALHFRDPRSRWDPFFKPRFLPVAAAKCTWEASFCLPTESHLWDGDESHCAHVQRYAVLPSLPL